MYCVFGVFLVIFIFVIFLEFLEYVVDLWLEFIVRGIMYLYCE